MANTENTAQNYRFLGMNPLDEKNSVKTLAELIDFTNFKPFNYYRGMIIFCHEDGKYYQWTDDLNNKQTASQNNYTYPGGTIYSEIDYTGLEFNFVELKFQGERGEQGAQGLQGMQGVPGPRGAAGNAIMTNDSSEIIYDSVLPFTIGELKANNWILSLGVNVKRLFFEHVCFPEYFKNKNLPTVYSIADLIYYSNIEKYNIINDNSVLLKNFITLYDVPDTEKFYFHFKYLLKSTISYTAKTPIFVSLNYSNTNSNVSIPTSSLIQDIQNNLGLLTKEIEIVSLPNKGEINHLNQPLIVGQKILYSNLSTPLKFAPNKLDQSQNNNDFITNFSYRLIDTSGNKSNNVNVEISSSYIISTNPPTATLKWTTENSQNDLTGVLANKNLTYTALDNSDVTSIVLEKYNGTSWILFDDSLSGGTVDVSLNVGTNLFRIKAIDDENNIGYSNVIKYIRENVILPDAVVSQDANGINTSDINNSNTECILYGTNFESFNGSSLFSVIWQSKLVSEIDWIDRSVAVLGQSKQFTTNTDNYVFRIKLIDSNGNIGYSNEIKKLYSGLATQSYWYQGRWNSGDTTHNPEVNSWVKYIDSSGAQITKIIGPIENGCQEVIAASIVSTNGVDTCVPQSLQTFGVYISNNSNICNIQTSNLIVGFDSLKPTTGDVVRKYDGTPYTGSYSYIKIFNYGDITNNNKVFLVFGNTGVLGTEYDCQQTIQ